MKEKRGNGRGPKPRDQVARPYRHSPLRGSFNPDKVYGTKMPGWFDPVWVFNRDKVYETVKPKKKPELSPNWR